MLLWQLSVLQSRVDLFNFALYHHSLTDSPPFPLAFSRSENALYPIGTHLSKIYYIAMCIMIATLQHALFVFVFVSLHLGWYMTWTWTFSRCNLCSNISRLHLSVVLYLTIYTRIQIKNVPDSECSHRY